MSATISLILFSTAASNLFKNVFRAYRLKEGIADDVDDRIVVADVVVKFFRQIDAYLEDKQTECLAMI